ncbi:MutS domain V [Natronincola peptidivorans]|uniref:MutS domain V n=1 Tax=Natronincola peptidivorans TaxID=426128 RepID=A0A1I0AKW4_9FIRM|nr:DNA mismatch repair protein MutS [Natronincola peptidivorans]SES93956.1 MutS domain V [Natronincola peptidivorans]
MYNYITEENAKEIGLKHILQKLPTQTPYGKEVKENINPYLSDRIKDLRKTLRDLGIFLEVVEKDYQVLRGLNNHLGEFIDIKSSFYRARNHEILNEVELFEIKNQIMAMEKLRKFLRRSPIAIEVFQLLSMEKIEQLLDPENTGVETFYIYDVYSEELTNIRRKKRELEEKITYLNKKIKEEIEEEIGIKPKLNGEILVQRENEQQIEKLGNSKRVHQIAENIKFFIYKIKPSKELKILETELEDIKLLEEEEEFKIRQMLSETIGESANDIVRNIDAIGQMDFIMGKAILALQMKAVKPKIVEEPMLRVKDGRHAVIEEKLKRQGSSYTPVDVSLEKGITLITGANMGGKTITLKMMALITAMAQLGFYVPAKEAIISPVSFVYFSSGDQQSEENGLSTFGAEIEGLKVVIEKADDAGLILIDELARGTNPLEGYGISRGVLEYLKNKPSISVVTTHFDGLSNIEGIKHLQVVGLKNVPVETLKEQLQVSKDYKGVLEKYMDYRLEEKKEEEVSPKDAIMIAKLMGLKEEIIEEASKSIREREEQNE